MQGEGEVEAVKPLALSLLFLCGCSLMAKRDPVPGPYVASDIFDVQALAAAIVKLDAKVDTMVQAQVGVGNTAVGGNQTIDSKASLAAIGVLGTVCLGLVRQVRVERKVSGLLVRTIETQRPNGGEAVVNSLKFTCGKGHPLAKALHRRVKKQTK